MIRIAQICLEGPIHTSCKKSHANVAGLTITLTDCLVALQTQDVEAMLV